MGKITAAVCAIALALGATSASGNGTGALTGVVVDANGAPLGGICITAEDETGHRWEYHASHEDGWFGFDPIAAGAYIVRFWDCTQSIYAPEWFEDKHDRATADTVIVGAGQEVVIAPVLEVGGSITGTVTGTDGVPLADICAEATPLHALGGGSAKTDALGRYQVSGLATGDHRVLFRSCGSEAYAWEYYDDEVWDLAATPVHVTVGEETADIDAVLERPASLRVSVVDLSSEPLEGICLEVWDEQDRYSEARTTSTDGITSFGLRPSTVKVSYNDCRNGRYEDGWFDGARSRAEATLLDLSEGSTFEIRIVTCDRNADSDGDGLLDCEEFRFHGTDPFLFDTDGDGLSDREEIFDHETDPFDPDTDNDLFSDGIEVKGGSCLGVHTFEGGSDPKDGRSTPIAQFPYGFGQYPSTLAPIC